MFHITATRMALTTETVGSAAVSGATQSKGGQSRSALRFPPMRWRRIDVSATVLQTVAICMTQKEPSRVSQLNLNILAIRQAKHALI